MILASEFTDLLFSDAVGMELVSSWASAGGIGMGKAIAAALVFG